MSKNRLPHLTRKRISKAFRKYIKRWGGFHEYEEDDDDDSQPLLRRKDYYKDNDKKMRSRLRSFYKGLRNKLGLRQPSGKKNSAENEKIITPPEKEILMTENPSVNKSTDIPTTTDEVELFPKSKNNNFKGIKKADHSLIDPTHQKILDDSSVFGKANSSWSKPVIQSSFENPVFHDDPFAFESNVFDTENDHETDMKKFIRPNNYVYEEKHQPLQRWKDFIDYIREKVPSTDLTSSEKIDFFLDDNIANLIAKRILLNSNDFKHKIYYKKHKKHTYITIDFFRREISDLATYINSIYLYADKNTNEIYLTSGHFKIGVKLQNDIINEIQQYSIAYNKRTKYHLYIIHPDETIHQIINAHL